MLRKNEEKSVMVCPFRIHAETVPSATIPDAMYKNEYFMPCLHHACPAYEEESISHTTPAGVEKVTLEVCGRLER